MVTAGWTLTRSHQLACLALVLGGKLETIVCTGMFWYLRQLRLHARLVHIKMGRGMEQTFQTWNLNLNPNSESNTIGFSDPLLISAALADVRTRG